MNWIMKGGSTTATFNAILVLVEIVIGVDHDDHDDDDVDVDEKVLLRRMKITSDS